MAERYRAVSKDAAIGLVMSRKAMSYDAAKAWLAAQEALGMIKPELYRHWPPYRLAELEAALRVANAQVSRPRRGLDDDALLEEMRQLVKEGLTVGQAAVRLAPRAKGALDERSRAERLRRKYRRHYSH